MSNINYFSTKKWGVMCHLLHSLQNNPERPANEGIGRTDWNTFVEQIDAENIAKELHEMGAGYLLLTLMQGDPYMIAPNATYDAIVGSEPGEYCSQRDFVLDLSKALRKYDIDLFLYYTGDGPHKNVQTGKAMGFQDRYNEAPIPERFLKNWSSVLKEYAERYKDVVKGWWIDGCYSYFGYDEERLLIYHNLLKSINPDWLIAYNDGYAIEQAINKFAYDPTNDNPQPIPVALRKRCSYEDFLAGEAVDFNIYPKNPLEDGAQWHILSPLADRDGLWNGWGGVNVKYTQKYLAQYFKSIWKIGGVITVDMGLKRSGKFYDEQKRFMVELMKEINE